MLEIRLRFEEQEEGIALTVVCDAQEGTPIERALGDMFTGAPLIPLPGARCRCGSPCC
jgi:hypothetical protein